MEKITSKNDNAVTFEKFMEVLPIIIEDLTSGLKIDSPELKMYVEELLRYLAPTNSKKVRGLVVPEFYEKLEKKEKLTAENIKLSYIMGWMIEMGQAGGFFYDDIMDKTEVRQGIPCWYTRPDIGITVIKDVLLLQECFFFLLRKYFSQHKHILSIYKVIHAGCRKTFLGQVLDCKSIKDGKPNMEFFTMKNCKVIAEYKTAYAIYVPVAIALYLANISDENIHKDVQSLLIDAGLIYQAQDDFLDCFGTDDVITENLGDDIRTCKCTWMAAKALEMANAQQRKTFETYYGSSDPKAFGTICKLYQDLDLPKMYAKYEKENLEKILTRIQELSTELPVKFFSVMAKELYNRRL